MDKKSHTHLGKNADGIAATDQLSHTKLAEMRSNAITKIKLQQVKRPLFVLAFFTLFAFYIVGNVISYGFEAPHSESILALKDDTAAYSRPDIVDRNGVLLATDVEVDSLFANPRKMSFRALDEVIESLSKTLPELDPKSLRDKLSSDRGFVWIMRKLTPVQKNLVHELGILGIDYRSESQRKYPNGKLASHVLGHVDIDNHGKAGIEDYLDRTLLDPVYKDGVDVDITHNRVELSIDARAQFTLEEELMKGKDKFQALAASGLIMDVKSGEIIALASIPDFDPNNPITAVDKNKLNRITSTAIEMGSTFKTFTLAMMLDEGLGTMQSRWDASKPIPIGKFKIDDFHGQKRVLTTEEVFIYSSNIGSGRMGLAAGAELQRAFLTKMGQTEKISFELPGVSSPIVPKPWSKASVLTISFGHGLSVTPLQAAAGFASLINGGYKVHPTLLKKDWDMVKGEKPVRLIKPETSALIRYLLRQNAVKGSGKNANVPGFRVGAKTGTAEKSINGRYDADKLNNSFLAAFPMEDPKYLVLILVDEPQKLPGERYATAAYNAARVTYNVIRRVGPILGIFPNFNADSVKETASLIQQ